MRIGIGVGLTGGRRRAAAWTPAALPNLHAVADVDAMRAAGLLTQDAGKTILAALDGDPVYVAVDSYTGAEWTAPSDARRATLRYRSGRWCLEDVSLLSRLTVAGVPGSLPFAAGLRWQATSGGFFTVPWGVGQNVAAGGFNSSNQLYAFTDTGFQSGNVYSADPLTVVWQLDTAAGQIRLDGSQVATGTNGQNAASGLNLLWQGANNNARGCRVFRAAFYGSLLTGDECAALEGWLDAAPLAAYGPYLWFGFDPDLQTLTVYTSADAESFTLLAKRFVGATGTLRDPSVAAFGGAYYLAWTKYGFSQGTAFGLAVADSFPMDWAEQTEVDCSDVITPGAGARCWAPDLYAEGGTLYATFAGSDDAAAFKLYLKSTTSPPGSWGASAQVTGTAVPTNVIDGHIQKSGGYYYLFCKDESSKRLHVCRSTGIGSGYDEGRALTEIPTYHEGPAVAANPAGGYWLFSDCYATTGGDTVGLHRRTFATLATLLAGTETASDDVLCESDGVALRHGCPVVV